MKRCYCCDKYADRVTPYKIPLCSLHYRWIFPNAPIPPVLGPEPVTQPLFE